MLIGGIGSQVLLLALLMVQDPDGERSWGKEPCRGGALTFLMNLVGGSPFGGSPFGALNGPLPSWYQDIWPPIGEPFRGKLQRRDKDKDVADPVEIATGYFVESVDDLLVPGRRFDLKFTRSYRSGNLTRGPLGTGSSARSSNKSRVTGDCHARFCEEFGGRVAGLTRSVPCRRAGEQGSALPLLRGGPWLGGWAQVEAAVSDHNRVRPSGLTPQ